MLSLHTILIVEFLHLIQIKTMLANGKKELLGKLRIPLCLIVVWNL
nr:MAG TPA_asm: hypothetical protein [Caudoviricetes sp.]